MAVFGLLACTSSPPATPGASVAGSPSTVQSVSIPAPTPAPPSASTSQVPETLTPTTAPTATPVATATPSATATATPAPLIVDWQRVSNPGIEQASEIDGSAAAGGRLVVIGEDQDFNEVIWSSGDGRSWSQADLPSMPGSLTISAVAADGNGFVAAATQTGSGQEGGWILKSDDGRSWQLAGNAVQEGWSLENIAVVGSNIVVVVQDENLTREGTAVAHDGGDTWSGILEPDFVKKGLLALTTTDDGFWAFALSSSNAKSAEIEIWRSTDGETWTSAGTLPGSAGFGNINVAHGPLGWVAIASTTQHNHEVDLAWWSADGVTWQAGQPAPFGVENIFADDAGFIAVGNWFPNGSGCAIDPAEAVGLTFTSSDGVLWERMSQDGWKSQYIEQLRRFNRTLIGIGLDYSQNDLGSGAVWTAKLPQVAANQGPAPTNPPQPNMGCGPG